MKQTPLRRYVRLIKDDELPHLLLLPTHVESEAIGVTADLSKVATILKAAPRKNDSERASWDSAFAEPLHQALKLPRRVASDMKFWHWLTISVLSDLVWIRWNGSVPSDVAATLSTKPSLAERFLGSATLRGVSRNALARLWWCADALYSKGDGYQLVREALSKQDLFQAIFERQFGLYPAAARACLKTLSNKSEGEWREATRKLNHYLTTIVVESLTEEQVAELIQAEP
jgi:hypothetical protein